MTQHSTTPRESKPRSGLPALVRDAFAGVDEDLTRIPIKRAVVLLAIPMVVEMAMEAVFAITDIYYVARLGPQAVAAVGLTEAVMMLVYAVAVGLGMGVTAVVARRVGEKDDDGAACVAGQTIWLGLMSSLLIAWVGIAYGASILQLMGAPQAVITGGAMYTRVLLGGAFSVVFIFLLNAIYRGAGLPGIAMRALVLANLINLVLDPCLIFGLGPFPRLEVTGAAVATTIGRSVGVVYLLMRLVRGQPHIRLTVGHLRLRRDVMLNLVRISLGGIGQFFIATASWVVLMRLVAAYGSTAIAGYTIAVRIIDFTILPAWGFGNAATTLVGQNLGAGDPQRARAAVAVVMRYTVAFMSLVGVVFIVFGAPLIALFSPLPEVIAIGADCLRFMGWGYGLLGVGMVLTQAFNGAGDTYTPTWINFLCFWLLQLPVAWWLAGVAGYGARGVFAAILIAEVALALLAVVVYRKGHWAVTRV